MLALLARWLAAFGYRNIAYLGLVAALVALGWALPPTSPSKAVRAAWFFILMNWVAASSVFFAVNAVLLVVAVVKGRAPIRESIACALPVLCIVVPAAFLG
jgi:hypothetical protein